MADRQSLENAVTQTAAQLGKIDILVNCAGITKRTPTLDVSDDEWSSILGTNLTGTWRSCQVSARSAARRLGESSAAQARREKAVPNHLG